MLEILKEYSEKEKISISETVSRVIGSFVKSGKPEGNILKMAIDIAADLFVANQAYEKHPYILDFLVQAGTTEEEVLFRHYIKTHPDILYCHEKGCDGSLHGGCPVLICDKCGRKHFLNVENITSAMCNNCVAKKLGECTEEKTKKYRQIYMVGGY